MRNKEIYSELADALSIRRGHVPVVKCDEFYALLKELFTKDEAELTCKMPLDYISLTDFTRNMEGADKKAIENRMEIMADKGLLLAE